MKRMLLVVGAVCAAVAGMAEDAWLRSGDSQYVNTGYFMKQASRIEVDFQFTAVPTGNLLFGAWDAGAKLSSGCWVSGGTFQFLLNDNGYASYGTGIKADIARHVAVIDVPTKGFWFAKTDGTKEFTGTIAANKTLNEPVAMWPVVLFGAANDASGQGKQPNNMRIYGVKIYENDVLVHDYRPCIKIDEPCFRDHVGGGFIYRHGKRLQYGGDIERIPAGPNTLRILPLGDSITQGDKSESTSGYRGFLWKRLRDAGYSVDYVGTVQGNPGSRADLDGMDVDHEGHGGWRIDTKNGGSGLMENIPGWFSKFDAPHVVLLHVGTNDSGNDFSDVMARMGVLLDRIYAAAPSTHVVLSTLLWRGTAANYTRIQQYNAALPDLLAAQQAKGRSISLVDLHAAVASDATTGAANLNADLLHPNATGYSLMADAWFAELRRLFPDPEADAPAATPTWTRTVVKPTGNGLMATLFFNLPMDAAALANTANYALAGARPTQVEVSADARQCTLYFDVSTSQEQTLSVQGLVSAAGASLPAATTAVQRPVDVSPEACVPASERTKYRLVYDWNPYAPHTSHLGYRRVPVHYVTDLAKGIADGSFKRVAYWFETTDLAGRRNWIWVSLDTFTDQASRLGIPSTRTGARFQQKVANVKYWSNKPELDAEGGRTVDEGNIEFWPGSFGTTGKLGLGGNDAKYDFDDTETGVSYGSMQIHDFKRKLTLFGINRFESNEDLFFGVGTNTSGAGHPDWVESHDFKTPRYQAARLLVFVEEDPADTTPLELLTASRDQGGDRVVLAFSREVAAQDFDGLVSVDGAPVKGVARDASDPTKVLVDLGRATAATLSVTVQGVRDASPAAHVLAGPVTKTVAAAILPPEVEEHVPADYREGYELLYSLEIPTEGYAAGAAPYTLARRDYPKSFDRIAYYLEIVRDNGTRSWVWSSVDAWTQDADRIAVPDTAARSQNGFLATNLEVASNVSSVKTGKDLGEASVEFWYEGYGTGSQQGLAGADDTKYDFDDKRGSGNFGSMQIHNLAEKKTVWAYNAFGRGFDYWTTVGIGPNTTGTGHPDWVNTGNSDWTVVDTTRRVLHVMVRPAAKPVRVPAPAAVTEKVDEAKDYSLLFVADIPLEKMEVQNAAKWTAIHTTDNRAALKGLSVARVGYYLELVKPNGETTWAWTSFDAFTQELQDLTFPTNKNFQQTVAHLNVRSNVAGVQTGDDLAGGSMEFISASFGRASTLGLPEANDSIYDWDDSVTGGYWGCLQVNNWQARQTVFSVTATTKTDTRVGLGIGNRTVDQPDWTFANNAGEYATRRLYVLVKEGPALAAVPQYLHAVAEKGGRRICVEFDVPVTAALLDPSLYYLTGGTIASLARSPLDAREVYVTLAEPAAAGASLKLGVYVPGSGAKAVKTVTVPDGALPALFDGVEEKGDYVCVYKYAVPNSSRTATHGGAYVLDESRFRGFAFDRVAYALHLVDKSGAVKWAWASMDAFTGDAGRLGVPCTRRGGLQQRTVDNLSVRYGWSGGTAPDLRAGDFPSGSIEFLYGGHSPGTSLGLPGGDEVLYDFDDIFTNPNPSYYSTLQIHDYLGKKTVIALGSLGGGNDTGKPSIGIGNCPVAGAHPDWTFQENADTYTVKDLYVLVRPVASGDGPAIVAQPRNARAKPREPLALTVNAPAAVAYQWRKNGVEIPGAQSAFLEVGAEKPEKAVYDVLVYGADGRATLSEPAPVEIISPGTVFIFR